MPCSIPATSAGNVIGKMAGTTKNCYKAPLRSSISATTAGMPSSISAPSAGNIIGKIAGTTKNWYKAPLRSSISATGAGTTIDKMTKATKNKY